MIQTKVVSRWDSMEHAIEMEECFTFARVSFLGIMTFKQTKIGNDVYGV